MCVVCVTCWPAILNCNPAGQTRLVLQAPHATPLSQHSLLQSPTIHIISLVLRDKTYVLTSNCSHLVPEYSMPQQKQEYILVELGIAVWKVA